MRQFRRPAVAVDGKARGPARGIEEEHEEVLFARHAEDDATSRPSAHDRDRPGTVLEDEIATQSDRDGIRGARSDRLRHVVRRGRRVEAAGHLPVGRSRSAQHQEIEEGRRLQERVGIEMVPYFLGARPGGRGEEQKADGKGFLRGRVHRRGTTSGWH